VGNTLRITYNVASKNAEAIAEAIRVEQSIEFPVDLAPEWIQRDVVGHVTSIHPFDEGNSTVIIDYSPDIIGGELPQFINVLWGNASILPGIRVTDVEYPDSFIAGFKGPRFGVSGLREMFNARTRPLVSTALKPMGLSSKELAQAAYTIAKAGFDTIKDDHSLANQKWATWRERVAAVAEAVAKANSETGGNCIYAPSLNLPADKIFDAAIEAKNLGATSLLILPGISGWDTMRAIAENDAIGLPIMAHPSFAGTHVLNPSQGLSHGLVFGDLARLAGADITIFPNFGGRFSFSEDECAEIARAARKPLGHLRSAWVSPAGGMTLERLDEMISFYGPDTACLIGGALHRGDLTGNASGIVNTAALMNQ